MLRTSEQWNELFVFLLIRRAIEPEGATCEGLGFVPGDAAVGIATPAARQAAGRVVEARKRVQVVMLPHPPLPDQLRCRCPTTILIVGPSLAQRELNSYTLGLNGDNRFG